MFGSRQWKENGTQGGGSREEGRKGEGREGREGDVLDAGDFSVADLLVEDEPREGVEELGLDSAVEGTGTDCEWRRKRSISSSGQKEREEEATYR